ncbi:MAG TPA: amino acid permease [Steroidobacter sp.]
MNLLACKPIEQLCAEARQSGDATLRRTLGTFELTCLGIGCTIGVGIFVLTGTVAAQHAGPAVVISFILASFACLLAGLCYAELASMIPVAGSAYSYTYAVLGEVFAWLVGWCLVLEYLLAGSVVAIGWSGYAQSALRDIGLRLPDAISRSPFSGDHLDVLALTGSIVDLPAVLLMLACTAVMLGGLRLSTRINNLMVCGKIAAILVVGVAGVIHADPANWSPFLPANTGVSGAYGWTGVLQGAAILFFAYVGFDAVSTMAQETRNPQRTIPFSLIGTLAVCTALYVLVSLAITGLADYRELDVADPIYVALDRGGPALAWAKSIVSVVVVFGLFSVLIVTLLGQTRIFYAMGQDGLLPACFARVSPRTGTPQMSTIVTGVVAAIAAGFLPLTVLGELISMGTLLAFSVVCIGVIVLRRTKPDMPRAFRVPCSPWLPAIGVLSCTYLMWSLPGSTWMRLLLWLAVGGLVYGLYGVRHSKAQASAIRGNALGGKAESV